MPAIVFPPFADTSTVLVSLDINEGVVEVVVVSLLAESEFLVPKNCAVASARAKITTAATALLGHLPTSLATFTLRDLSIRQTFNRLIDSRSSTLRSPNQKEGRLLSFHFEKNPPPALVIAVSADNELALKER